MSDDDGIALADAERDEALGRRLATLLQRIEAFDLDFSIDDWGDILETVCRLLHAEPLRLSPGDRTFGERLRIAERNQALRDAAARFHPGRPRSEQAAEIARAWADYDSRPWLQDRSCTECPKRHLGMIREVFWRMNRAGNTPIGERRIRDILDGKDEPASMETKPGYSFP